MSLLTDIQDDGYSHPPHDLIPELMVFGVMEEHELIFDSGRTITAKIINYKGLNYIMKMHKEGRWFDKQ